MKLAVLVLAHKLPQQLHWLVALLQAPDVAIFVHVDAASQAITPADLAQLAAQANVHCLAQRRMVHWGNFQQIQATWDLLRAAHAHGPFDRYVLVSGQDLPLMPPEAMLAFFQNEPDTQFLEYFQLPAPDRWSGAGGLDRLELYWLDPPLDGLNRLLHGAQRRLGWRRRLDGGVFHGGANWFNLTGPCVAWLLDYVAKNTRFFEQFRHSRCADEIIVQTLVLRSPFAAQAVPEPLRFVNWTDGPEFPRTLRMADLPAILAAPRALFARKFDPAVDAEVGPAVVSAAWQRYRHHQDPPPVSARSADSGCSSRS